jgi:hypothetical protein
MYVLMFLKILPRFKIDEKIIYHYFKYVQRARNRDIGTRRFATLELKFFV